jgi:hypothetical protein
MDYAFLNHVRRGWCLGSGETQRRSCSGRTRPHQLIIIGGPRKGVISVPPHEFFRELQNRDERVHNRAMGVMEVGTR